MNHKYLVGRLDSGEYELHTIEEEKDENFTSMKDIVEHLKNDKSSFTVLDEVDGIAHFENGEVIRIESLYGINDDYMMKNYMGIEQIQRESEPDCRTCGDGGCPSCVPDLFI